MGIGMILLPIFFLSVLLAITIGIVLAIKTHNENKIRIEQYGDTISFRRSPLIGLLGPLALVFAACFLFMGYWVWCEGVLGEDPGFGDEWHVRLTKDYSFTMIDTTETGAITWHDRNEVVYGIRKIGRQGDFLFGENGGPVPFEERRGYAASGEARDDKTYFLFDMASDSLKQVLSEEEFRTQCEAAGIKAENLYWPESFYNQQRQWVLMLVPFVVAAGFVYPVIKFIKYIFEAASAA